MAKTIDPTLLPEPVARFAQAEVDAGHYSSVEDVLCASIEALQQREQDWVTYAREKWDERVAAGERGESTEGTPAEIVATIRARVERAV